MPALPKLCEFLQRNPETAAACRRDCFRKTISCRDTPRTLAARCYAGLSYRIVPIRLGRRPHSVILVGRVLAEVFGGEQCLGLVERFHLPRESFLESFAGVRSVANADLDRVAGAVRRLAFSFAASHRRFGHCHTLLGRQRDLLALAGRAVCGAGHASGRTREALESIGRMFGASGVALIPADAGRHGACARASIGLDEDALQGLFRTDWRGLFASRGGHAPVVLAEGQRLQGAGAKLAGPAVITPLQHGQAAVGHLVLTGTTLSGKELEHLRPAAAFVAALCVHEANRERAERKDEEARLLGEMAEKCLAARSVDELLPLALEAMMHSLHARRGSILLADSEQGRVVARALRGEHAPISRSIDTLAPGSVSHRVFFERRPLLVEDVGREPGLASARQFPYASRSFVSVPLRADDGALGVLHLTEREGEGVFTPSDLSLLERLSFQAAGAICRIRLEEEVRSLRVASVTDHLTGMHNRRYLDERLAVEFQRASRFGEQLAVVMMDLDRFKDLNDLHGHDYGDRVLRELAGSIRGLLRSVDVMARYGGDEFVLVLPETGVAGALRTVGKIREHLARPDVRAAISPEVPGACSVSVGVSVYPGMGGSVEELLRRADEALLKAKSVGRDTALVWNG